MIKQHLLNSTYRNGGTSTNFTLWASIMYCRNIETNCLCGRSHICHLWPTLTFRSIERMIRRVTQSGTVTNRHHWHRRLVPPHTRYCNVRPWLTDTPKLSMRHCNNTRRICCICIFIWWILQWYYKPLYDWLILWAALTDLDIARESGRAGPGGSSRWCMDLLVALFIVEPSAEMQLVRNVLQNNKTQLTTRWPNTRGCFLLIAQVAWTTDKAPLLVSIDSGNIKAGIALQNLGSTCWPLTYAILYGICVLCELWYKFHTSRENDSETAEPSTVHDNLLWWHGYPSV